jgi:hypothetical protein
MQAGTPTPVTPIIQTTTQKIVMSPMVKNVLKAVNGIILGGFVAFAGSYAPGMQTSAIVLGITIAILKSAESYLSHIQDVA